jgi:hypothetical protein
MRRKTANTSQRKTPSATATVTVSTAASRAMSLRAGRVYGENMIENKVARILKKKSKRGWLLRAMV